MGQFVYDHRRAIEIEDGTLAHLQLVIIDKLRRKERFSLDLTDGRHVVTMWLTPATPLEFIYPGNRRPTVNNEWLEAIAGAAGVAGTLTIVPEPNGSNRSVASNRLRGAHRRS